MLRNFFFFSIALLLGSSCATAVTPQTPLPKPVPKVQIPEKVGPAIATAQFGQPVQIEVGSKALFASEQLEISVLSVNDSRCPKDLNCYWAGEAKIELSLRQEKKDLGKHRLTLGAINPDYLYPNSVKQIGAYYVRVLALEPYPDNRKPVQSKKRIVTLQVQKTPFNLKNADLDPKLKERPLDAANLGNRFALLNSQSYYLSDAKDYIQAQIDFESAQPIASQPNQIELALVIHPVGKATRLVELRETVKLGVPLQIERKGNGYNLRLMKVESFVEDTRTDLNSPSPIGYRALLQVVKD